MSVYPIKPFDLSKVRTYPLRDRPSKVCYSSFARTFHKGGSFLDFLASLPEILAGADLRALITALAEAKSHGRAILWGLGGHVIKVGLGPTLIDLMTHGFVSGLAINGSAMIHDFEIALVGATSEDVEAELGHGRFGMAEETGRFINEAINAGFLQGLGLGESVGRFLASLKPEFADYSLLAQAYRLGIPVTVHLAIGTDIINNHPTTNGAALGEGSHIDFRLFSTLVEEIHNGGVYLNVGSAVVLPEVFLKAVTLVRNAGASLERFTTVNLDFVQHYRPTQNVVKRPTKNSGQGLALTGHHEILIPLIAAALIEKCH
ncbi:MAG: hypothetical protein HYR55_05410 [Acidobacteria bacterium]|nr:hypothetical protein [Acidobacteriota bacterium]MBI3657818.1 hypothetical protein [Acidobacteriota bacterium]